MSEGLKYLKYATLQQESDPLEFCVCTIPLPMNIGIPFFPCEIRNNFTLFQSNENHTQIGLKIMDLEEEEAHCLQRCLICPSSRPFTMTSRDFYNNIPIQAERALQIPYCTDQVIMVKYEGQYAGKVVSKKGCEFLKGTFQTLELYDSNDQLIYELNANIKQWGLLCFLPFKKCERIRYTIRNKRPDDEFKEHYNLIDGYIEHIFYGWDNEFCSKADQYGIQFPDDACEKDKALIVMSAIFIDYLWFENF